MQRVLGVTMPTSYKLCEARDLAADEFSNANPGAGLSGSRLLKAAADRGQEVDFAGFLDRVEQAADPHLAIDRNVDA